MSTITKQWLQKAISQHESMRDEIPFGLDEDESNTLAALRIALASLEAEPYGYVHKAAYEQAGSCGLSNDHEAYRDSSTHIAVYTAPPAPVSVPDGYRLQPISEYDAMCAAMLQGADGNSPDGWVACSERMPEKGQEVLCTDRFENYETALYDTGYIPGPPFFATTAGEFHPSHWMPLPTPPQK